jgi:hypothetical protein
MPSFCLEPADAKALAARSVTHIFGPDSYGIVSWQDRSLSRAARTLAHLINPKFLQEDD